MKQAAAGMQVQSRGPQHLECQLEKWTTGYSNTRLSPDRISSELKHVEFAREASRPAMATTSIRLSQPAIHNAAIGFDGVRSIGTGNPAFFGAPRRAQTEQAGIGELGSVCKVQMRRCYNA